MVSIRSPIVNLQLRAKASTVGESQSRNRNMASSAGPVARAASVWRDGMAVFSAKRFSTRLRRDVLCAYGGLRQRRFTVLVKSALILQGRIRAVKRQGISSWSNHSTSVRATRKPMLLFRLSRWFLLRLADRAVSRR